MNFEDHFSHMASIYSKYRPGYPSELFKFLSDCCWNHELAWDCGTGNGQAAQKLSEYFQQVYATDASSDQIDHALPHPRINFRVEPAENVSLGNSTADLVTVAVAVHWFDLEKFYNEVKRVLKPEGIIAVWMYHLPAISSEIDAQVEKYYSVVLKDFWPDRFQYVDSRYSTLPFPFKELSHPGFNMKTVWDLDQLSGFLSSWSAVKTYHEKNGTHPLNEIWQDLKNAWGDENVKRTLIWPLYIRVGMTT
jgi:SAM-dependent methyltransferase